MNASGLSRRSFLEASAAGLTLALARGLTAATPDRPVRLGMIGMGSRGTVLLRLALMNEGLEIPALCDIDQDHLGRAQRLVERAGGPKPEGYSRGPEDWKRMLERPDLDAVVCATPKEWHTPIMVGAMEAGKYAGTEVPAAVSLEECWQLVETSERTGVPCMMLENYVYFRNVMLALNMLRQGLFGTLIHCEAGYQKDERLFLTDPEGRLRQGLDRELGNLYPTHALGPMAVLLDVNRGDRFSYLVSMSTGNAAGRDFLREKFGADNAADKLAGGDMNVTLLRTEKGGVITLYYDTRCARPWDATLRIQGSKGIFMGSIDKLYLEGHSPQADAWEDAAPYYEKYEHPLWRKYGDRQIAYGRGVCDFLALNRFIEAARKKAPTPLDVYDAAAWSAVTPLTAQSVERRSAPVDFPDFTRGKWEGRAPFPVEEA